MSNHRSSRRAPVWALVAMAGCAAAKPGDGSGNGPDAGSGSGDPAVISISPTTPHTADDLNAVVAMPGAASYHLRWTEDDSVRTDLIGYTVPAADTGKGQVWKIDLLDNDGAAVISTDQVTILNTPPTAPEISVPAGPLPGDIQCTITTLSSDPDDDSISYTASWTRNGVAFDGATTTEYPGDTVPGTATFAGDVFECTMVASDGEDTAASQAATAVVCAGQQLPGATTFSYTGAAQSYVVGPCVTKVLVETWGAQGGGSNGGPGGYASGVLDVSGGATLIVQVGGQNGYNGGGAGTSSGAAANGGGGSDVRVAPAAVGNRVIAAGGGGGGGNGDGAYLGGAGGAGTCGANYCGGGGGAGYPGASGAGLPGGDAGGAGVTAAHAGGGGGGGASSGGGASCETYTAPTACGTNGSLGQGGAGETRQDYAICFSSYVGTAGGGGGYYGGGGTATGYCGSGAGGGGSSWTGGLTTPTFQAGVRAGNGQVKITPTM
jgi:hypothetical protein